MCVVNTTVLIRIDLELEKVIKFINAAEEIAVSYTHLDVYKRQHK